MKIYLRKSVQYLMAAIMVLAMASTAFAADAATTTTGSITVTGLTANDNTTLKVYKVVGFDEVNSDWTIESWAQNHATNTNHVVNIDWEALKSVNSLPTPVKKSQFRLIQRHIQLMDLKLVRT